MVVQGNWGYSEHPATYKSMGKYLMRTCQPAKLAVQARTSYGNIKPSSIRTGANSNLRQHYRQVQHAAN
jgi:hypothetical protein